MAGAGFVATETISFLATFISSLADSKITSNDGIPGVQGQEENVRKQSVAKGFCSMKKHTGKREHKDDYSCSTLFLFSVYNGSAQCSF